MSSIWRTFPYSFLALLFAIILVIASISSSASQNTAEFIQQHDSFHQVILSHFHSVLSSQPAAKVGFAAASTIQQPVTSVRTDQPFLPAGYVYVKYSNEKSDASCARASMTVGIPVDTCVVTDALSYRVQITTDNCVGAAVFYYRDANCTSLQSNQSLSAFEGRCNVYDGAREVPLGDTTMTVPLYFWQLKCTAQPTKPIPVASAVVELYSDSGKCQKSVGYSTMSADLCLPVQGGQYSTALRCSASGTASLNEYIGGTCGSVVSETTPYSPSTCAATSSLPSSSTQAVSQLSTPHDVLGRESEHSRLGTLVSEEQSVVNLSGVIDKVAAFRVSCAQKNTDYSAIISVVQVLEDVTYSAFQRDAADSTLALQHAIAAALNASRAVSSLGGVQLGDVYITQVAQYVEAPETEGPEGGGDKDSKEDCGDEEDGEGDHNGSHDHSSDQSNGSWSGEEEEGSHSGDWDSRGDGDKDKGGWKDNSDTDCESEESHGRNSSAPTARPTRRPSAPTVTPTRRPSAPSTVPSRRPTAPSALPTRSPTSPTAAPSTRPTSGGSRSGGGGWNTRASSAPSVTVTRTPTSPTVAPTRRSNAPTSPAAAPTRRPASVDTFFPTRDGTRVRGGDGGLRPSTSRADALTVARSVLAAPYSPYLPNAPPNTPWHNNNNGGEKESDALSVSYTVVCYQPGLSNDKLADALSTAVHNGTFDRLLKRWAVVVGARGLTRASSSNLIVNALVTDSPGGGPGGADPPGGGSGDGGAMHTAPKPVQWFTVRNVLVSVGAVVVGVVLCFLMRALYFRVFPGSDAVLPQLAKPVAKKEDKDKMLKSDEENYDGMEEEDMEVEVKLIEVQGYAAPV